MIIQVISDIHAERHRDWGESFVQSLNPADTDVLVVAGDAGNTADDSFSTVMTLLCGRFPQVVAVLGNHELYGTNRENAWNVARQLQEKLPNLHILENSTVTIEGQRFIGCTMWFPDLPQYRRLWGATCDFDEIKGFPFWFDQVNRESVAYLRSNIQSDDIVVTHYVPTPKGSHKRWKKSFINGFFICDVEDVIKEKQPKMWVYGHTHDRHSLRIGKTRLVCNPFWGVGSDLNADFDEHKVVEV